MSNTSLAILPRITPSATMARIAALATGPTGLAASASPSLLSRPRCSLTNQLAAAFGRRPRAPSPRRSRRARARDQHARVVERQAVGAHEALLLLVGQLGQMPAQILDVGLGEFQRQEVGIGEIAVVVRLLLGAHRARLSRARDRTAASPAGSCRRPRRCRSGARLGLDRLADEADRVHVLDLAARRKRRARPPHRDVDVGAQVALLHVAVAGAEVAQDRPELRHVGLRLFRRAHLGLRHDLHQRHARAVEIDVRAFGVLVVDRLARVLLQVQALDADADRVAVDLDLDLALPTIGCLYWLIW